MPGNDYQDQKHYDSDKYLAGHRFSFIADYIAFWFDLGGLSTRPELRLRRSGTGLNEEVVPVSEN